MWAHACMLAVAFLAHMLWGSDQWPCTCFCFFSSLSSFSLTFFLLSLFSPGSLVLTDVERPRCWGLLPSKKMGSSSSSALKGTALFLSRRGSCHVTLLPSNNHWLPQTRQMGKCYSHLLSLSLASSASQSSHHIWQLWISQEMEGRDGEQSRRPESDCFIVSPAWINQVLCSGTHPPVT